MKTQYLYPLRLEASLHETLWGGKRLEKEGWKHGPSSTALIGESWETEVSSTVQNGQHAGKTLGTLVHELGAALLGQQATAIFGQRFPLLAKFIDANTQLSVQVHPDDQYATMHEGGKLGKTEFWYILAAEPGATITHGFKEDTTCTAVQEAIQHASLESLLHEEPVTAGDVIYVPAGTVHAIGGGILLYELQEYSDITYRMYDYGRLTASGKPRELHIAHSLAVAHFTRSPQIKMNPVMVKSETSYDDQCLVACKYFVTRKLQLKAHNGTNKRFTGQTGDSCSILSSIGAEVRIHYGSGFEYSELLSRGQTIVLPAALGEYCIEGHGSLLLSYVPGQEDHAWQLWQSQQYMCAH